MRDDFVALVDAGLVLAPDETFECAGLVADNQKYTADGLDICWIQAPDPKSVPAFLQRAFDQAGIAFAPRTQSVRLQADADTVRRVSAALRRTAEKDPGGAGHD